MLRIIDNGDGWRVVAEWHGAERTVHGPTSIFKALAWARENAWMDR